MGGDRRQISVDWGVGGGIEEDKHLKTNKSHTLKIGKRLVPEFVSDTLRHRRKSNSLLVRIMDVECHF